MKRTGSAFLALILSLSIIPAVFSIGVFASIGDGSKTSVEIKLQAGRVDTSSNTFIPLKAGEKLNTGDRITVRICPQSDFLCGATRYIVLFSKDSFELAGTGKAAFKPNPDNTFYKNVADGYNGSPALPNLAWPSTFDANENYSVFTAVAVGNQADSNSVNGGHPALLPGTWLFQFDLKVIKDINSASTARIFMDKRWIRSTANTTGQSYFARCTDAKAFSSSGNATFEIKAGLKNAGLTLPLTKSLPADQTTAKTGTTKNQSEQTTSAVAGTSASQQGTNSTAGTSAADQQSSGYSAKNTYTVLAVAFAALSIACAAVYIIKKKK
jgi:hypothetical protein